MQSAQEEVKSQTQAHLERVQKLLGNGTLKQIDRLINGLRPVEIARLLQSSPPPSRQIIWDLIEKDSIGEVLEDLPEDIRGEFLRSMEAHEVVGFTEGLRNR